MVTSLLPPVDDAVKIPDSVKRAAARADALHQQVYQTEPAATPPADGDAPIKIVDTTPPPLTRESTPAGDRIAFPARAGEGPPATPATPEPTPPPAPEPPKLVLTPRGAPTPEPEPAPQGDDPAQLKHQYLSMKGRYDQLSRTHGATQEQLVEMSNEVMRLQSLLAGRAQQAEKPAVPQDLTPAEREHYGEEFITVAQKVARAAVQPELETLKQQNQRLLKEAEKNQVRSIHQTLDAAMPNWREINRSQQFSDWLSLPDFYAGVPKGQMLQRAFAAGDAPRVLRFFQGFVAEATGSAHTVPPLPATPRVPNQPAYNLEALAAPGPAKPATGSDGQPAQKPIYTNAQIKQFYRDVNRGLYAGRETDKTTIEQDIIAAGREGRVRG